MAKEVTSHSGTILVAMVILFDFAAFHRINGYVHEMSQSNHEPRRSYFDSAEKDGPVPSCPNSTFCLETPYYPSDLVDALLRGNNALKYLATVDEPLELYRQDYTPEGEALCSSQEMVVTPKSALSIGGQWLYIVNQDKYVQTVRVEICTSENRPCKFIDGFADGWTSICKQSYIYRQMVAITGDGRIAPRAFKLPACCKCYVKFTGDPYARLGVRLDKSKRIDKSTKRQSH